MSIKILDNDSIFLSVSCDLWGNMHNFNYHYYATKYNSKEYPGNKEDKATFKKYYNLFKHGRIYDTNDIEKVYKEFTELKEYYNDYLKIVENKE